MKRNWLAVMAFFLLLVLSRPQALAAVEQEVSTYLKALELFSQEKFPEGIKKYYKFIITAEPLLSVSCRKLDLAKALDFFSAKNKANPQDLKTIFSLSLVNRILYNWTDAETGLEKVRQKAPKSALLTFVKGEFLLRRRLEEEARKTFAFLEQIPMAKNFFSLAKALMEKAGISASIEPEQRKKALLRIALRHYDLMEYSQAEEILHQLRKEFPTDREAPKTLAMMYLEQRKFKEADQVLQDWASANNSPLIPPADEARLKYAQEKYDVVVSLLKDLDLNSAGHEALRLTFAESLFMTGAFKEALPHFKKLHDKDPADPGIFHRLVNCLEKLGQTAEMVLTYQSYVEKNPKELVFKLEYIAMLERQNDLEKAEDELKKITGAESPYKEYIEEKLKDLRESRLKKEVVKTETAKQTIETQTAVTIQTTVAHVTTQGIETSRVGKSILGSKSKNELEMLKRLYGK